MILKTNELSTFFFGFNDFVTKIHPFSIEIPDFRIERAKGRSGYKTSHSGLDPESRKNNNSGF